MKRRYVILIIVAAILSLIVGGKKMVESKPFNWFESGPKKATIEDRRNFLKQHEAELGVAVKKMNPSITSVQFDWKSVEDGEVENGLPWGGGKVVDVYGKFNGIKRSYVHLQFALDSKTGMPDLKSVAAPNDFMIEKNGVWVDYDEP